MNDYEIYYKMVGKVNEQLSENWKVRRPVPCSRQWLSYPASQRPGASWLGVTPASRERTNYFLSIAY